MQFDLESVRARFPALSISDDGVRRIYLDNPAGTQVPASVADAMSDCLLKANANLGGYFASSADAGQVVDSARAAMADFLNASSPDEIVFGQNMTTITLHMSRSIGRLFNPGDEIVLSRMDHDANVWPWVLMARDLELNVKWLPFSKETFEFDLDVLDGLLTEKTRLLCVGGASNLTGTINDIAAICAKAGDVGAITYIDAVQSAPHIATDVQRIGCDFFVCSAYKFFGPHQGILWGRRELLEELSPYKVRPAPDNIPDCFETGTQSHEDFAGVGAAIDYFAWVGETMAQDYMPRWPQFSGRRQALHAAMDLLFDYEKSLAERLIDGLKQLDGVTVQGITAADALQRRVPTVAFTHDSMASDVIAKSLAEQNIFVWSGHNYAIEVAKTLGIYETGGAVRIGPVHYNSHAEIDELLGALAAIVS
jgi:cysteine desulfurase family protein (TIGR01976 family)